MLLPLEVFNDQTYFSAAHHAGLLPHPVIGWARRASTHGRELRYDPELPLHVQRAEFIEQIAERRAEHPEGGSFEYNARELHARIAHV